jgi:hypothetical protein
MHDGEDAALRGGAVPATVPVPVPLVVPAPMPELAGMGVGAAPLGMLTPAAGAAGSSGWLLSGDGGGGGGGGGCGGAAAAAAGPTSAGAVTITVPNWTVAGLIGKRGARIAEVLARLAPAYGHVFAGLAKDRRDGAHAHVRRGAARRARARRVPLPHTLPHLPPSPTISRHLPPSPAISLFRTPFRACPQLHLRARLTAPSSPATAISCHLSPSPAISHHLPPSPAVSRRLPRQIERLSSARVSIAPEDGRAERAVTLSGTAERRLAAYTLICNQARRLNGPCAGRWGGGGGGACAGQGAGVSAGRVIAG